MLFIADGRLGFRLVFRRPGLLRSCRGARPLLRRFTAAASPPTTSAAIAAAEELKTIHHNFVFAALCTAFLIVPRFVLETAFHQQRLSLLAIFIDRLGLFPEAGAVDEQDLLAVLALRSPPLVIDGQSKLD